VSLVPVVAGADVHDERDIELGDALHEAAYALFHDG